MKQVQIKPVVAYANGKQIQAEKFKVSSVFDNLFDHVIFKYTLLDASDQFAGEATYELRGEYYKAWDNSPENAYQIVAAGIGVEIIGENTKMFEVE